MTLARISAFRGLRNRTGAAESLLNN